MSNVKPLLDKTISSRLKRVLSKNNTESFLSTLTALVEREGVDRVFTENGGGFLHWVAQNESLEGMDFLVKNGGDIHSKDKNKHTPLDALLNTPCARYVLESLRFTSGKPNDFSNLNIEDNRFYKIFDLLLQNGALKGLTPKKLEERGHRLAYLGQKTALDLFFNATQGQKISKIVILKGVLKNFHEQLDHQEFTLNLSNIAIGKPVFEEKENPKDLDYLFEVFDLILSKMPSSEKSQLSDDLVDEVFDDVNATQEQLKSFLKSMGGFNTTSPKESVFYQILKSRILQEKLSQIDASLNTLQNSSKIRL